MFLGLMNDEIALDRGVDMQKFFPEGVFLIIRKLAAVGPGLRLSDFIQLVQIIHLRIALRFCDIAGAELFIQ